MSEVEVPFTRQIDGLLDWLGLLSGDEVPLWRWAFFVPLFVCVILLIVFASVPAFFFRMVWPLDADSAGRNTAELPK